MYFKFDYANFLSASALISLKYVIKLKASRGR